MQVLLLSIICFWSVSIPWDCNISWTKTLDPTPNPTTCHCMSAPFSMVPVPDRPFLWARPQSQTSDATRKTNKTQRPKTVHWYLAHSLFSSTKLVHFVDAFPSRAKCGIAQAVKNGSKTLHTEKQIMGKFHVWPSIRLSFWTTLHRPSL